MTEQLEKKIKDILDKNHLIPDKLPDEFFADPKCLQKRYYITPAKLDDKKVLVKFLISTAEIDIQKFNNEIKFHNEITGKSENFYVPSILKSGTGEVDWYAREYIEAETISDGHYIFKEELARIEKYITKAVSVLEGLIQLDLNLVSSNYPATDINYYLRQARHFNKYVSKYFPDYFQSEEKILEEIEPLLSSKKMISHADFHLGNLFFENDRVTLEDWENIHLGNIAEDFTDLLVTLWQSGESQSLCWSMFVKKLPDESKEEFDKLVRALLIHHVGKELEHWTYYREYSTNKKYPQEIMDNGFQYFKKLLEELLKGDINPEKLFQ